MLNKTYPLTQEAFHYYNKKVLGVQLSRFVSAQFVNQIYEVLRHQISLDELKLLGDFEYEGKLALWGKCACCGKQFHGVSWIQPTKEFVDSVAKFGNINDALDDVRPVVNGCFYEVDKSPLKEPIGFCGEAFPRFDQVKQVFVESHLCIFRRDYNKNIHGVPLGWILEKRAELVKEQRRADEANQRMIAEGVAKRLKQKEADSLAMKKAEERKQAKKQAWDRSIAEARAETRRVQAEAQAEAERVQAEALANQKAQEEADRKEEAQKLLDAEATRKQQEYSKFRELAGMV